MGGTLTVPYPFDVVIDGQGYVSYDGEENKAAFGLTPTFVPRTNVQGNYGDNQQEFWLTHTQKDWSKGEQQKYQGRDEDGQSRFWRGKNLDARVPGEVLIRPGLRSFTPAAAPTAVVADIQNNRIYFATSTNLYHVTYDGTITSVGAHGLGAAPARQGAAFDGRLFFLTTTAGGTVGVRQWDGASFTTFSGTGADALAFLNNTLYGYITDSAKLIRYSSGGTASDVFLWRNATAAGSGYSAQGRLVPFGGKLLILRYADGGTPRGPELWLYDGTSPTKIAEFPQNFVAFDCEVLNGTVLVSGHFRSYRNTNLRFSQPAIYFYKDGQQDLFWKAEQALYDGVNNISPPLCLYDEGLVFQDWVGVPNSTSPRLVYYNASTGGFVTLAETGSYGNNDFLASTQSFFIHALAGTTTAWIFPHNIDNASTAEVDSSLLDFDTSLQKVPRGVRAIFDVTGTATVDLSYRFNDIDGSYASLQTNVTSGTEYLIATPAEGTTYRAISVRATLNRGATTSSNVKLRRMQVRAIPVQPAYKKRQYVLNLGGRDGEGHVVLRDETTHVLDGLQMAANLQTAAARTSPFTIVDHLSPGSGFTGVIESLEMREFKPEEFIAVVTVREV